MKGKASNFKKPPISKKPLISRRLLRTMLSLFLALMLSVSLFSGFVGAWSSNAQPKTNEFTGSELPIPEDQSLSLLKIVRNLDGSELTQDQLDQLFEFTVDFSDGRSCVYYLTAIPESMMPAVPVEGSSITGLSVEGDNGEEETIVSSAESEGAFTSETIDLTGPNPRIPLLSADYDQEPRPYSSGDTIYLRHGQMAVFSSFPVGVDYVVTETPVAGFSTSSSGAAGTMGVPGEDGAYNTVLFINTFDNKIPIEEETVEINGEKTWEHGDNSPENYPKSITVKILADGVVVKTITVNQEDSWKWSVELPEFDEEGKAISYTIDEDPVPNYTKKVDGYNLINTYTEPPKEETVEINGEKTWEHGDNSPENYPKSIAVKILADGVVVKTITVNQEDSWKWSVELPEFDEEGKAIAYTIDEEPVPNYTKKVDGYNLINTYVGSDVGTDTRPDIPKTSNSDYLLLLAMLLCLLALSITIAITAHLWLLPRGRRRIRNHKFGNDIGG